MLGNWILLVALTDYVSYTRGISRGTLSLNYKPKVALFFNSIITFVMIKVIRFDKK